MPDSNQDSGAFANGQGTEPLATHLYERFMSEAGPAMTDVAIDALESGRAILASAPEVQAAILVTAFRRPVLTAGRDETWIGRYFGGRRLMAALLRKPLPLTESQMIEILTAANTAHFFAIESPRAGTIRAVERYVDANGLSNALRATLEAVHKKLQSRSRYSEDRELAKRVFVLLGGVITKKASPISGRDAWSKLALDTLAAKEPPGRDAWTKLLEFAETATSSKPSARWLKHSGRLLDSVGKDQAAALISSWLALIGSPSPYRAPNQAGDGTVPDPENATVLKGLVWAASNLDEAAMAGPISAAAEACFKKIPNIGPRSVKLGNDCLWYLSTVRTDQAIAELVRIRGRAKHPSVRKQIDAAIARQAASRGQTPEDAMELAIPTFGLALPGVLKQSVGGFEAELSVTGTASTQLIWKAPTGKISRCIPKAAREADRDAVTALTRLSRSIERTLGGQRDRLERLYLAGRSWSVADWKKRFADHALLHHLVSRLIWDFASGDHHVQAVLRAAELIGIDGRPLPPLAADARVTLWHPIHDPADQIAAWRTRLASLDIRQPFKQAHREIYLLTDAERQTRNYSNRFAAHILRQHQMAELCRARGWTYRLAGMHFDNGGSVPELSIPIAGLTASFWTEPVDNQQEGHSGIALHVSTDQVSFVHARGGERTNLEDIPPIVFSEVMRDVDLFVGVCSVGNDPDWQDGGPDGAHRNYWRESSFGNLNESGTGRREVLADLLPRLKIGPLCSLADRFVVVKGTLRTYKIHLGSGNILMEPNDQYLCIVPSPKDRSTDGVMLPFEGDRTLSVILSKAFMLAEDDRISDPSITRQIRGT